MMMPMVSLSPARAMSEMGFTDPARSRFMRSWPRVSMFMAKSACEAAPSRPSMAATDCLPRRCVSCLPTSTRLVWLRTWSVMICTMETPGRNESTTPSKVTSERASMVTVPGSSTPFLRAIDTSELKNAPMSSSDRSASPNSAMMASRSARRCA